MDITSKDGFNEPHLSNLFPYSFVLDGVECASMEGFLQSLKYQNVDSQYAMCQMWGNHAKKKGSKKNKMWKKTQTLHWQGKEMDRHSEEYQQLLDRAYAALAENELFRQTLLATGKELLTHSIGIQDPHETVLTEEEFCGRLMKLREMLQKSIQK